MVKKNSGLTLVELIAILFLLAVLALLLIPSLARDKTPAKRAICQNSLKQMGLIFRMYSEDSVGGEFPPMMVHDETLVDCATEPAVPIKRAGGGDLAPLLTSIYPEYLSDLNVFVCPAVDEKTQEAIKDQFPVDQLQAAEAMYCDSPEVGFRSLDSCYHYTGYALHQRHLENEAGEPTLMLSAFRPLLQKFNSNEWTIAKQVARADLRMTGAHVDGQELVLYRLRKGAEKFFVTDVNNQQSLARSRSEIWVMHDRLLEKVEQYPHAPGGSNVLFMDGHVEFLRYAENGRPPLNASGFEAYEEIRVALSK